MSKDELTASNINDADITVIQEFVNKHIIAAKHSMPSGSIYSGVKKNLSKDLGESLFKLSFSANVKTGRISGILSARKAGYKAIEDSTVTVTKSIEPTQAIPENVRTFVESTNIKSDLTSMQEPTVVVSPVELLEGAPQPAPLPAAKPINNNIFKHAHHLWIGRRTFKLTRTFKDLEVLVCDILGGMKSEEGNVVFNGERYSINSNAFVLEKFVTTFWGAIETGNTDPIENNPEGIPVELTI